MGNVFHTSKQMTVVLNGNQRENATHLVAEKVSSEVKDGVEEIENAPKST